jgi:long-chain acyl-CoA synthetase
VSADPPTLVHALIQRASEDPDGTAFRTLVSGGASRSRTWSWSRWKAEGDRIAQGLGGLGVGPGDRVAILAGNTPVWPLADLGILRAGAVSVGLYPSSAPRQVGEILRDSGAGIVFVDTGDQLDKVREVLPGLPELRRIVLGPDLAGVSPTETEGAVEVPLTELMATGTGGLPILPEPEADAVLIYTSGSTGTPRGARLTHAGLVASAVSVRDTLGLRAGDRMLSFLPFCHAAERIFGQATRLVVGIEAGLVSDPGRVFQAAAELRPTVFGGLPRFYEKIYEAELAERGPDASPPSPAIQRMTGGEVRVATSGGAALPREVAAGLGRLGLEVLGAYGLTEHLCCTFNRPGAPRFDDVGLPMPGTELRIAEDGEILVRRSALTFAGYHARPEETREAFTEDGRWLRTGDLGRLDPEGRLTVVGRKKELLALSTGKKVAPLLIEARLVDRPWIDQAVLVGEGRKFVGALLTLRRPVVEAWAREAGLTLSWPELIRHPGVEEQVQTQVSEVNAQVSRTESVRRFHILSTPLTVESGELTPTLKPRRDVILRRRAESIEALYRAGAEAAR